MTGRDTSLKGRMGEEMGNELDGGRGSMFIICEVMK